MKQYIVDAFTDKVFSGNPAAICILDEWVSEELMMAITLENNLSETAFAVKENNAYHYHLRWFTPGGEIDLCGHATLACAYVILRFYETDWQEVYFKTKSGLLHVLKNGNRYEMDMPAYKMTQIPVTDEIEQAIGIRPTEAWMGRDLVCIMESEEQIVTAAPNMERVKKLDGLLLHITAKGTTYDCISRTFAPKMSVEEDPVCGSGHCHIIPLWTEKLGNKEITARQSSRRGGTLYCQNNGDRVKLAGEAALYSVAELFLDSATIKGESE